MSELLEAADESAALELLHELQCTDGLPVVIPTPERVERLVLATGLDRDVALGEMGPAMGVATVEKVATAAVMAGCTPDHKPVVVAAVKAIVDPRFDLAELQATTHCTAPIIIVNGPARQACGDIASGYGALGPGHRAPSREGATRIVGGQRSIKLVQSTDRQTAPSDGSSRPQHTHRIPWCENNIPGVKYSGDIWLP